MALLDKFEAAMIVVIVGQTPQRAPADMKMAVSVLDQLEGIVPLAEIEGKQLSVLLTWSGEDPREVGLSDAEAKFVSQTMVTNGRFGGNMLRKLIPLWEKLYPKWEELG